LEGMLNQAPLELIPLAKSWIQPPLLSNVKGCTGNYNKAQRAYIFEKEADEISMTVLANEDSPVENICMIFKQWNSKQPAQVHIDGNKVDCKQGIVRDTDGSYKLLIWIEVRSSEPVDIEVES
jgi:hypothetical protein